MISKFIPSISSILTSTSLKGNQYTGATETETYLEMKGIIFVPLTLPVSLLGAYFTTSFLPQSDDHLHPY